MSFRAAPTILAGIVSEMLRIFDAGAEIRFFSGPQPDRPDLDLGDTYVASRLVICTTEAGTVAGQAITFDCPLGPAAEEFIAASKKVDQLALEEQKTSVGDTSGIDNATAQMDANEAATVAIDQECRGLFSEQKVPRVEIVTGILGPRTTVEGYISQGHPQGRYASEIGTLSADAALAVAHTTLLSLQSQQTEILGAGYSTVAGELAAAEYTAGKCKINVDYFTSEVAKAQPVADAAQVLVADLITAAATNEAALTTLIPAEAIAKSNAEVAIEYSIQQDLWRQHAAIKKELDSALSARSSLNAAYNRAIASDRNAQYTLSNATSSLNRVVGEQTAATALAEIYNAALAKYAALLAMPEMVELLANIRAAKAEILSSEGVAKLAALKYDGFRTQLYNLAVAFNALLILRADAYSNYWTARREYDRTMECLNAVVKDKPAWVLSRDPSTKRYILVNNVSTQKRIPSEGWCRVVHPSYPALFIDGTYGAAEGPFDFPILRDLDHYSGDRPYTITLTLPSA